ncbi:hypothetical protein [uncultured Bacteroides sp.]|uniref:hypothetical protein n=1 Tax=uncultured Bacteroides sp. TaxID=162156 RepID=UPI002614161A|nr:hypothetical protein [uncultured Bacteroides sp.]
MGKYEESLKVFRDLNNVIDTAEWKGRKEEKRTIGGEKNYRPRHEKPGFIWN